MGLQIIRSFPNMNNQAYENTQDFQESSDLPSSIILVIPRGELPLMYRGISIVGNSVSIRRIPLTVGEPFSPSYGVFADTKCCNTVGGFGRAEVD